VKGFTARRHRADHSAAGKGPGGGGDRHRPDQGVWRLPPSRQLSGAGASIGAAEGGGRLSQKLATGRTAAGRHPYPTFGGDRATPCRHAQRRELERLESATAKSSSLPGDELAIPPGRGIVRKPDPSEGAPILEDDMITISEPIATRPADHGTHVSRIAAGALIVVSAIAWLVLQPGQAVAADHDFTICHGRFALCAASTCKATGKNITVNVTGGGTATFPEYDCTCPILDGPSIADLTGGNMQGSCTPPPGQIWSLYQPREHIPQAITNWNRAPSKSSAPPSLRGRSQPWRQARQLLQLRVQSRRDHQRRAGRELSLSAGRIAGRQGGSASYLVRDSGRPRKYLRLRRIPRWRPTAVYQHGPALGGGDAGFGEAREPDAVEALLRAPVLTPKALAGRLGVAGWLGVRHRDGAVPPVVRS
jgi:hypothetical protein